MKLRPERDNEKGQSLLIISLAMVAIIAMVTVVLDAGNDYVQRRQMQNSTDAGAEAGGLKLAQANSTNGDVSDAVRAFVQKNGTDPNRVSAYYVVQDNTGNSVVVRTGTVDTFGRNNPAPKNLSVGGSSLPVIGVQVEGDRTFNTWFAGLLGFPQLTVPGASAAYVNKGSCSGTGLFPVTLNISSFPYVNGVRTPDYTQPYQIFEKNAGWGTAPGNFGWLSWTADPSNTTLDYNMMHLDNSGRWNVGDWIPASTGVMASSSIRNDVQYYIDNRIPVVIPIFDTVQGTGSNAQYHAVAFAQFLITVKDTQGNPKSITGMFQQWVNPSAEGGCTNLGVVSVMLRPAINVERALVGTVRMQQVTVFGKVSENNQHVPVDVMNVLDISGSMNDQFGPESKLQGAKDALTAFNNSMQPLLGDQVGLVTFPLIQSGASYSYSCTQNGYYTNYYFGQLRSPLSPDVPGTNALISTLTANGGTPLAAGLLQGRQAVLGLSHRPGNVAVILVASDGLANIRLNGRWTGFSGNAYSSVACNGGAEQDALVQANIAKGDTNGDGKADVVVYSIAVGNDFNPALLQSIATPDTDPSRPHYFRAENSIQMASIYQQIATQVQTIYNECRTVSTEAFAPNATVTIRMPDGSTQSVQTTSTGEFVLTNVPNGTYQVTGASVTVNGQTYNVPTDGVGGPTLSFPLSIQVGTSSGTYKTDVFLKTANNITCNDS